MHAIRHALSRADARRIAIRAQLLHRSRPAALVPMVRHLTFLQLDPISAVAPSADLVSWSRLGGSYQPGDLRAALDAHELVELLALVRPAEDIALYRAAMDERRAGGPLVHGHEWVRANDKCRRDILARLADAGPLPSRDLPDTCEVAWASTGWTNNKNVTQLGGLMSRRGEVAVAGRKGRDRLWDLAERVYPDVPALPVEEAARERDRRRLAALGIARGTGTVVPVESALVGSAGEPATVEGVKGEWRVDPGLLDRPFSGRTALLSPFDRLVHDRKRLAELFEYEYQLEMYKPVGARRWGYFALPILHGDRLIGKLDATADRKAKVLRVNAVHEDVPFTAEMSEAVRSEIADLATWLDLGIGPIRY